MKFSQKIRAGIINEHECKFLCFLSSGVHYVHRIQQPTLKLRILNFHEILNQFLTYVCCFDEKAITNELC